MPERTISAGDAPRPFIYVGVCTLEPGALARLVDRGEQGTKRSMVIDARGITLGVINTSANR